jgi:dUTP pyrophosphatase
MRLKIKRLDAAVGLPEPATAGAAGFDLASAVDVDIPPRSIRLVGTGLVIAVPDGYFLGIFARSSTPLKRGLMVANGVGVVDADYCGPADEIKIQLLNITDAPRRPAGSRDCASVPPRGMGGSRRHASANPRGVRKHRELRIKN